MIELDSQSVPFLTLPSPHSNIVLTPPRITDGEAVICVLNDPRVYMNLSGPPFPYTRKDWDDWFPITSKTSQEAGEEFAALRRGERKWVGAGVPVGCIREKGVDGVEKFIGEVGARRRLYEGIADEEERAKIKGLNDAREAGDPEIEWEFGFYLAPEFHGRGIIPAAIKAMLNEFMIPYMNVHIVNGAYFDHNRASRRVFEKKGFVLWKEIPNFMELPQSKTGVKGQRVGLGIMRWKREILDPIRLRALVSSTVNKE